MKPTAETESVVLAEHVTSTLEKLGHPTPTGWKVYLDPKHEQTDDWKLQQFFVNTGLQRLIGEIGLERGMDTREPRRCLILTDDKAAWLNLFDKGVAPWLIQNAPSLTLN